MTTTRLSAADESLLTKALESLGPLLLPVSGLYALATSVRNGLYERGLLRSEDCGKPVISVGNLTAGGTGKTPFTAWLAREIEGRGLRPAIISRGYRAVAENGVERVELDRERDPSVASRQWGDEPVLLAEILRSVPVFVGRDKVAVARRAVRDVNPNVIIADDAFQHRRLHRSFDLVLLDATEPETHYRLLPSGRLREPFAQGLRRADAIVITKTNIAGKEKTQLLRARLRVALGMSRQPVIMEFESNLRGFSRIPKARLDFAFGSIEPPETLKNQRLLLVSAIGRPAAFEALIRHATDAEITGHVAFGDHHFYDDSDLRAIAHSAERSGASAIVMTEKDAVKIPARRDFGVPLWASRLDVAPRGSTEEFHAHLARSLR